MICISPNINRHDSIVTVLRHWELYTIRVPIVWHDNANKRSTGDVIAWMKRHWQKAICAAFNERGQPLEDLRVVFAQIDSSLAKDRLYVKRHLLPSPLSRFRKDVKRKYEHISNSVSTRTGTFTSRSTRSDLTNNRAAKLQLGAP
uniref:Uncharacterized protein n=1 Tax=Anopheles culicifacies TaxID=139723 RepID=A0A182MH69_9DIPT